LRNSESNARSLVNPARSFITGRGMTKILLVEDNDLNRDMLSRRLERRGYAVEVAKPFENRHLLGKIGDFYERLKDSYDEKFYQQEVLGSYLSMDGGRVYSAFDRNEHVREVKVNPNQKLWWALDFNVDPMSSLMFESP